MQRILLRNCFAGVRSEGWTAKRRPEAKLRSRVGYFELNLEELCRSVYCTIVVRKARICYQYRTAPAYQSSAKRWSSKSIATVSFSLLGIMCFAVLRLWHVWWCRRRSSSLNVVQNSNRAHLVLLAGVSCCAKFECGQILLLTKIIQTCP